MKTLSLADAPPGAEIVNHDGTFIRFIEIAVPPERKTKVWTVHPRDGGTISGMLGRVSWYPPWRKYCYLAEPRTVYEQVCLREIAEFCEKRTAEHKAARAG